MNELNQISLSVLVLLLGGAWLVPLRRKVNALLYWAYAWLLGWGFAVLGLIAVILCGLRGNKLLIVLSVLTVTSIVYVLLRTQNELPSIHVTSASPSRLLSHLVVLTVIGTVVVLSVLYGTYIFHSTDSLVFEGLGQNFHLLGAYAPSPSLIKTVVHIRQPFLAGVLNIAHHASVPIYYSFYPQLSFIGLLLLLGVGLETDRSSGRFWFTVFPVLVLLYGLNPNLILHSFFHHANLLSAVYFAGGVFSFLLLQKDNETDSTFFLLGCLLLGLCCLARKEMLLFSLIPFLYLQMKDDFPKRAVSMIGSLVYLLIAYSWTVGWFFRQLSMVGPASLFRETYHGGWTVIFGSLLAGLLTFLLRSFFTRLGWYPDPRTVGLLIVVGGTYALVLLGITRFDFFRTRVLQLQYHLFNPVGRWGLLWHLTLLCAVFYVSFYCAMNLRLLEGTDSVAGIDRNFLERSGYLLFVLSVFLLGWIVIYTLYEQPTAYLFTDSGNRVLLVGFFPAAYVVSDWVRESITVVYEGR